MYVCTHVQKSAVIPSLIARFTSNVNPIFPFNEITKSSVKSFVEVIAKAKLDENAIQCLPNRSSLCFRHSQNERTQMFMTGPTI